MPDQESTGVEQQVQALEARLANATWTTGNIPAIYREKQVRIDGTVTISGQRSIPITIARVPEIGYFAWGSELGAMTRQEALDRGLLVTERNYYIPLAMLFTEEYQWARL